jgi:O-antigen/teichoic acid export membrane protein
VIGPQMDHSESPADATTIATPPSPASRASTLLRAAGMIGLSISHYVVAFASSALVSRALGPELRGVYYLPVLAASTLLVFCRVGIDQANIFLHATRGITVARLAGQNGFVALTAGLAGCAMGLALPLVSPGVFGDTPIIYLFITGLTIPLGLHFQFSAGLLTLTGRPAWYYRAGIAGALVQIVLLVLLIVTGAIGVFGVLCVTLAVSIVNWAVVAFPLRNLGVPWMRWDRPLLSESLRSSLVLHLAMLLLFLHLRVDMFMVKAWMGNEALGHYSLSVTLAETLMLATDAVALAVLPGQVSNTLAEAGSRALRAARGNFLLGLTVAIGWTIVARPLVGLVFGEAFLPSVAPMLVLLPGMVLLGMQRMAGPPVLRAGRPAFMVAIYSVSLAANAALNVVWIPRWGLAGAAAASTLTYALSTALFLRWTARIAGIPLLPALVPTSADLQALQQGVRDGRGKLQAFFSRVSPPPQP